MSAIQFRILMSGLVFVLAAGGPAVLWAKEFQIDRIHQPRPDDPLPARNGGLPTETISPRFSPLDLKRGDETSFERADLIPDGMVNARDLLEWVTLRHEETGFGNETPFAPGDLNGDRTLNALDVILLQCEWMRTEP